MEFQYLIEAKTTKDGLELIFFDPLAKSMHKILNRSFRPYFYLPYPISHADKEKVERIGGNISVEKKKELFSNIFVDFTKVSLKPNSDPRKITKEFDKVWEGEVPVILGYLYDHDMVFGAPYEINGNEVSLKCELDDKTKASFERKFSDIREKEKDKYQLIERLFRICSQPIPEIPMELMRKEGSLNSQENYQAFTLSRLVNLPVSQAYSNRHVSTWIRSILHNHLRRKNVLIPTSKELRQGETQNRVQGGLTFPPESGVYFNTVVTDFESLYPTLIDICNLSYETVGCSHTYCRRNLIPGLKNHVCTLRRGVYSVLIGSLRDLRILWYKPLIKDEKISNDSRERAKTISQLLKLILVSSYGVTVRTHGLARPSLAEAITAYGRYSLQTTWNKAKKEGLYPIYGDTDSIFLNNPRDKQVQLLIKAVKEELGLDLAVDENYSICVLPRAMKAYFGIRKNGTADIKGVTAIKSNSPLFIQEVFKICIKELANVENSIQYEDAKKRIQKIVVEWINNLKAGKVSFQKLEYQVALHEDPLLKISEKILHQPYQCAAQLIDIGKQVNRMDVVRFLKVKPFNYRGKTFRVKPTEIMRDFQEVNVEDYVRNLRTALNQTFKPMNLDFESEKESVQTLADFM